MKNKRAIFYTGLSVFFLVGSVSVAFLMGAEGVDRDLCSAIGMTLIVCFLVTLFVTVKAYEGKKLSKIVIGLMLCFFGYIFIPVVVEDRMELTIFPGMMCAVGFIFFIRGLFERNLRLEKGTATFTKTQERKDSGNAFDRFKCDKCGKFFVSKDKVRKNGGERYCKRCLVVIEQEKRLELHTPCVECGVDMLKASMHFVGDDAYCHKCYVKKFMSIKDGSVAKEEMPPRKDDVPSDNGKSAIEMIKLFFAVSNTQGVHGVANTSFDSLYVVYLDCVDLPLCYGDTFCAFTSEEKVENRLKYCIRNESLKNGISIRLITRDAMSEFISECCLAGFRHIMLDGRERIGISLLPDFDDGITAGRDTMQICNSMMLFKETALAYSCEPGGDELSRGDKLAAIEKRVLSLLCGSHLLLPVTDDSIKYYPRVSGGDGTWLGVFTDEYAVKRYFKGDVWTAKTEDPFALKAEGTLLADDIKGFIVNPGRENFFVTKAHLNCL